MTGRTACKVVFLYGFWGCVVFDVRNPFVDLIVTMEGMMFGAIAGAVGKAVLGGGIGKIAKQAAGSLFEGNGLGGMLSKLVGGKGGGRAEHVLGEIKSMLSTLIKQMGHSGGRQCSQAGGHQSYGAGGCGAGHRSHIAANPGHGHAQECGVAIPGFGPSCARGGNDLMHGGPGDDRMYGGRGNDRMYGD